MKPHSSLRKNSVTTRASQNAERANYGTWSGGIAALLDEARRQSARSVNAILTATYWEIGRRIVEFAQEGDSRAGYGEEILDRLSADLTKLFSKGFGRSNLFQMKAFYLAFPEIVQTPSGQLKLSTERASKKIQTLSGQFGMTEICGTASDKSANSRISQTMSAKLEIHETASRISSVDLTLYLEALCHAFPLSWSHYVRLLSVEQPEARKFYEAESLRGGWSVRQLDRQISTLYYERTALSKNKAKLLATGAKARSDDAVSVGNQWYRIDLLLFHRRLRCLFIFDLKLGRFTHADAGQMNLYVNYAAEHLTLESENPPVGLILCSEHDEAVARYSMGNLTNKVLAGQYKLTLPDPHVIEKEIEKTRRLLESPARRLHQK